MSVKVVAAINSMNKQGHYARVYRHQNRMWVEIDQCMLASFHEIEELVDGVHSFEELAELFKRRHAEAGRADMTPVEHGEEQVNATRTITTQ